VSDNSAIHADDVQEAHDRFIFMPHPRRRHASGRPPGVRVERGHGSPPGAAQRTSAPADELAALMDDIRANGHPDITRGRLEPRRRRRSSPPAAAMRPDVLDRRHATSRKEILAGTGRAVFPYVGGSVGTCACCRPDRGDRRRQRARRRAGGRRHPPPEYRYGRWTSRRSSGRSPETRTCGDLPRRGATRWSAFARGTGAGRGRSRSAPNGAGDGGCVDGRPARGS